MKIHVVKHHPKTDEEVLDQMIKENSQVQTSMRKATKDAKAKFATKKAAIEAREAKVLNADDVSEVETVVPS